MSTLTRIRWNQTTTTQMLEIRRERVRAREEILQVLESRHLPESEARKLLAHLEWQPEVAA
jgi:hypothetical protein